VKPGSGSNVAAPLTVSIVQLPSPATTRLFPPSVASAEVNTTEPASSVPDVPVPSSPAESFANGSSVTVTFCGVIAVSSDAAGGAPTITVSRAVASCPWLSVTR